MQPKVYIMKLIVVFDILNLIYNNTRGETNECRQ